MGSQRKQRSGTGMAWVRRLGSVMMRSRRVARGALGLLLLSSGVACSAPLLVLDAPNIAPATARSPSPVDLEPIATGKDVEAGYLPPGPAAVLTAAISGELRGRALHGGESGGYTVRCTLDRFATRASAGITESHELLTLYADLSCEASRTADHAAVWRGELRARTVSAAPNVLGSDTSARQHLFDRALSDAARELASDLAIRALGLRAEPSARVFEDESHQRAAGGLDDTPFGPWALQETAGASGAAEVLRKAFADGSAMLRAAAWNAVAMAAGPGDDWTFGAQLALDDDSLVRFVQYKALARLGSASALAQLRAAASKEGDALLTQFLGDVLTSGGTGLSRTARVGR